MPAAVRIALYSGIFLAVVYLVIRVGRSKRQLQGSDLCEAVGLALAPSPVPGAVMMIVKAFESETLPIFNGLEDRLALILGGAMLIGTFFYGSAIALRKAWRSG